ncbi:MAG: 3,4-dihydroxy-2-butanone-4-phosphate synthase [Alphaproteobacteria bacterium]|nr:3,4-dihydroxy-2-butanone-4-phosphate synthase [Alphaproteobacteria bacterium]
MPWFLRLLIWRHSVNQTTANQLTLAEFGTPEERVACAVKALQAGEGIVVMDDENRENEGDVIFPADTITPEQMALLIREGTGIVCLSMTAEKLDSLALPQMVADNSSSMGTAFTVSIEAKHGVTTGVSATDRVTTIRAATASDAKPGDLARPGHVFPLRAHPGGVMARAGHTEAALEFVTRAGHSPAAVLCEIQKADGSMARLPDILSFAKAHDIPPVTIEDLKAVLAREAEMAA